MAPDTLSLNSKNRPAGGRTDRPHAAGPNQKTYGRRNPPIAEAVTGHGVLCQRSGQADRPRPLQREFELGPTLSGGVAAETRHFNRQQWLLRLPSSDLT